MDTQNQRAVYEWVNISDDLVYDGPFFLKARYMNGVGFEILAGTPVQKLSPSYNSLNDNSWIITKWAGAQHFLQNFMCAQPQRLRSTCAPTKVDWLQSPVTVFCFVFIYIICQIIH